MLDPGPRYRKTPYGWEPLHAFPAPAPAVPAPFAPALQFIQETIDCGVPPRRAVKYWGYILATICRRAAA